MRRDNRPCGKMLMEPAQSVDVDRAVVHPDALPDSGRLPEAKECLVDQINYVAHFNAPFLVVCLRGQIVRSDEFVSATGLLHGQPVVAVSENSLRTRETRCFSSSSELGRSG